MFGGSGLLGRQTVRRLADDGASVRIAVRHPERASFLAEIGVAGQITTTYADVWDEATVSPALEGVDAVVYPAPRLEEGITRACPSGSSSAPPIAPPAAAPSSS